MKALRLEDIRPQPAEFYLKKTDRSYELRPIGLEDEKWLRETFGSRLQSILEGSDVLEMGRIIWRLMKEEDRREFPAYTVEETDELGELQVIRKGGVQSLIQSIVGPSEKIAIHRALLQTIGISKPILDRLTEEELKKNLSLATQIPSAGVPSSISSRESTGGRSTTSGSLRPAKSQSRSKKST